MVLGLVGACVLNVPDYFPAFRGLCLTVGGGTTLASIVMIGRGLTR